MCLSREHVVTNVVGCVSQMAVLGLTIQPLVMI